MIAQTVFGIFSSLAVASAQSNSSDYTNVTLVTESDNSTISDKYFSARHEGAGISTVFLSNTSSPFYLSTDNTIKYPEEIAGNFSMSLAEYFNSLTFTVTGEPYAVVNSDNYVAINGSTDVFYICDSVPFDPYNYGERSMGVSVYSSNETVPESCQSIQIRCEPYNSTSNGSTGNGSSGNSSASASASHSASRSASHSRITSSHHNATTSEHLKTSTSTTKHTVTIATPTTLTEDGTTYTYTAATTDVRTDVETVTVTGSSNAGSKAQIGAFGILAALAAFV